MAKAKPYIVGDVLDLGCGAALVHDYCGDSIKRYVGVEKDAAVVEGLRRKYPTSEFHVKDLDRDELDISGNFDAVVMIAVVEHLFNQKHLFTQIARRLKPSGKVVITTPTVFGNDIVLRIGGKIGLFWRTAEDEHIVIYNKNRFQIIAREVGLQVAHFERFELGCNQLAVLELAEG